MRGLSRHFLTICFLMTAQSGGSLAAAQEGQDAILSPPCGPLDVERGLFEPPPGDPWYQPPQARGPRESAGDALVSKTRLTPHWFSENDRFWYRNDLAGGKREFVVVDARARHARAGV